MFPISNDSVPEEENCKPYEVLSTYADCISRGPWDLGSAKGVKHPIDTGSAQPIQVPPKRVPFHERQEMRRQVDEMLEAQNIGPSESPRSSPVVLVAKPDGTQRFCVDYRALNKVTKQVKFQLDRDAYEGSPRGSGTMLEQLLFILRGLLLLLEQVLINFSIT